MWQARLASTPPVHHASATQTAPPTTAPAAIARFALGRFASTNAIQASTAASAVRPSSDDASWPWKNPRQNSSSPGTDSAIESSSAIPSESPPCLRYISSECRRNVPHRA